jgi:hypothetical protein
VLILKILRRFLAAIVADQPDDFTAIGQFNFLDPHRPKADWAADRRRQKPWVKLLRLRHRIAPPFDVGSATGFLSSTYHAAESASSSSDQVWTDVHLCSAKCRMPDIYALLMSTLPLKADIRSLWPQALL